MQYANSAEISIKSGVNWKLNFVFPVNSKRNSHFIEAETGQIAKFKQFGTSFQFYFDVNQLGLKASLVFVSCPLTAVPKF